MEKETLDKVKEIATDALEFSGKVAKEGISIGAKIAVITAITGCKFTKILAHKAAPYVKQGLAWSVDTSKVFATYAKDKIQEKSPEMQHVVGTVSKKLRETTARVINKVPDRRIFTIGVPGIMSAVIAGYSVSYIHTRNVLAHAHQDHLEVSDLLDNRGIVSQAVVFYDSDDDADRTYIDFMSRFQMRSANWDITDIGNSLVRIKTKENAGTPIEFYVNHYNSGAEGVAAMLRYFKEHNIHPTGYQLRAHNFDTNLERFTAILPSEHIPFLMLGSCRGDRVLKDIRDKHPGSQILYTEGTGHFVISNDIVTFFAEQIRQNQPIMWGSIKGEETQYARERGDVDTFEQYKFPGDKQSNISEER